MPIFQSTPANAKTPYNAFQAVTDIFPWQPIPLQIDFCGGLYLRIISQALSGSLSGFYFTLMIYHTDIKTPFTAVLRALQEYGGGIPAIAAWNVAV